MGRLQLCGLRMAPVPELLLLLILPWATSHSGDAALGPARDQGSPISDLRLHPRLKMLTWTCRRPAIPQACVVDAPGHPPVRTTPRALDDDTYFCSFPNLVLHRGASFEVHTVLGGATFQEALRFDNPGRVGASAANLSCVIYEVQSMNCSWLPGRTAPGDTVYRLFFWFDPKEAEAECPQYLLDSKGLRVGCHFTRLGGEPKTSDNYFFLVNGTSSEATIPFLDTLPFVAFLIEKYTPPANVSVSPAGMGFVVHWDNPARRFDQSPSTLFYELDIRRKGDAAETQPVFQRGQERNAHALAAGTAGSSVRVRVRHLRGAVWSEWSAARDVGADRDRGGGGGGGGGLALARVLALVAAVALCTAALAVVCKRCRLQQRLLPPVPQVKDELRGVFAAAQEATVREAEPAADCPEPEDVLTVEAGETH